MELKICSCNVVLKGSIRRVLFFKCDYFVASLMNQMYAEIFNSFHYNLFFEVLASTFSLLTFAQRSCRAFWDYLCRYSVLCRFHFIIYI